MYLVVATPATGTPGVLLYMKLRRKPQRCAWPRCTHMALLRALGADAPRVIFATGSPQEIPEDIADLGPVLAKPYDFERLVELARARARTGLFSRLRRD